MKKKCLLVILTLIIIFFGSSLASFGQEQDIPGSKNHPLLGRMDNYVIDEYAEYDYVSHELHDEKDNEYIIEGHKWIIGYTLKEGYEPPGQLKVRKNYINAVKGIGGKILWDRGVYMMVTLEEKEIWIDLWVDDDGSDYRLTMVEKTVMEQEVEADPEALSEDLKTKGHVAIYGIYFDYDRATIRSESEPALKAISEIMAQNRD